MEFSRRQIQASKCAASLMMYVLTVENSYFLIYVPLIACNTWNLEFRITSLSLCFCIPGGFTFYVPCIHQMWPLSNQRNLNVSPYQSCHPTSGALGYDPVLFIVRGFTFEGNSVTKKLFIVVFFSFRSIQQLKLFALLLPRTVVCVKTKDFVGLVCVLNVTLACARHTFT